MTRTQKIAGAILFERFTSLGSKPIDVIMVILIVGYGPWYGPILAFSIGLLLELIWDIWILEVHLITSKKGNDWTKIADYKAWVMEPVESRDGHWLGRVGRGLWRCVKWLLRHSFSHYVPMVFFWSVVYVESDYVTLLLRKPKEDMLSVFWRVMLPAATWSILVWTALYWAAVLGYAWASYVIGPLPEAVSWEGLIEHLVES